MKNYYKLMLKNSIILMILFMGVIFSAGTIIIWELKLDIWVGIIFSIAIAGFQFLISPVIINMMYSVEFLEEPSFLNAEVVKFIEDTCKEIKIPVPRIGIIHDGNPNAFTYGHIPRDARVVVTSGLIDVLSVDELKAVIAHELGHIKHYDFILMTIVSLIPMILYQIYLRTRNNKSNAYYLVGLGAYGVYILSGFLVLSFSRIREYYADNFSRDIIGNGQQLKNALIKIAYGTASREKNKNPRVSTMGFTNNIQNDAFMLSSYKLPEDEKLDKKLIKWDLKNLWGRWYEFNSTHPLTAKRILALDEEAMENSTPTFKDIVKFLLEVAINLLPWITFIIILMLVDWNSMLSFNLFRGFINVFKTNPLFIVFLGFTILIKYYYSNSRGYEEKKIYELLAREDASPVKGIPAILEGKIIGRGIPGLFYSEDLVIDDGTGIMLVDYRQPLKFIEFLFGTFEVNNIKEHKVKVIGWYKRGIKPYFLCRHIILGERKIISYNYILTELLGYLLMVVGLIATLT